jgi:hypothetical protein
MYITYIQHSSCYCSKEIMPVIVRCFAICNWRRLSPGRGRPCRLVCVCLSSVQAQTLLSRAAESRSKHAHSLFLCPLSPSRFLLLLRCCCCCYFMLLVFTYNTCKLHMNFCLIPTTTCQFLSCLRCTTMYYFTFYLNGANESWIHCIIALLNEVSINLIDIEAEPNALLSCMNCRFGTRAFLDLDPFILLTFIHSFIYTFTFTFLFLSSAFLFFPSFWNFSSRLLSRPLVLWLWPGQDMMAGALPPPIGMGRGRGRGLLPPNLNPSPNNAFGKMVIKREVDPAPPVSSHVNYTSTQLPTKVASTTGLNLLK